MPSYVYVLMLRRKTGNWITKMLKVTLCGYNSEHNISLYWTSLSSVFSQSSIINAFRRKRTAAFVVRRKSWRANSEMAPGLLPPGCVPGIISSPECGGTVSVMGCHSPTLRFCVWLKKCCLYHQGVIRWFWVPQKGKDPGWTWATQVGFVRWLLPERTVHSWPQKSELPCWQRGLEGGFQELRAVPAWQLARKQGLSNSAIGKEILLPTSTLGRGFCCSKETVAVASTLILAWWGPSS